MQLLTVYDSKNICPVASSGYRGIKLGNPRSSLSSPNARCEVAVMHPEFQKWGSIGPWFLKNEALTTKCGFHDICHILNLGLMEP